MNTKDIKDVKFSIAMSVYKNDDPNQLREAINSICNQTVMPSEIFIVVDGPIGQELKDVLNAFCLEYPDLFTLHYLEKNAGLGNALKIAVTKCKYDIIARMDSDDVSVRSRFERQLKAFIENEVDVLGGWTIGFFGDLRNGTFSSFNPKLSNSDLHKQIGIRTPISHVTAMFKRQSVLNAGNYQDLFYHEDYYLWARMMKNQCVFMNIPEYLVFVRCGEKAAARHGGIKYYRAEKFLRKYLLKNKLCSLGTYVKQMTARFIYEIIMTPKMRVAVDKKFKRKYICQEEANKILDDN